MTQALASDHVCTARSRGKPDGALHEITPMRRANAVMQSIRDRSKLDTERVDDLIVGIVTLVGEQDQVLPRLAAISADSVQAVAGV